MDDLLNQLIGQEVVDALQTDTLAIQLSSGARLSIYNKVSWLDCAVASKLKGRMLAHVSRRGKMVVVDFEGLRFEFLDEFPDTAAPEVAAVHFPDGRIFVHQGEDAAP